jgi:hypothetical protein
MVYCSSGRLTIDGDAGERCVSDVRLWSRYPGGGPRGESRPCETEWRAVGDSGDADDERRWSDCGLRGASDNTAELERDSSLSKAWS